MLAAPSGTAGFLSRHLTAALSAVALFAGIATAAASVSAWFQHVAPVEVAMFAAATALVAAAAFWHTRHLVMALLIALTPLPGLVWAAPLSGGSHFALVPFVAYGFATALASLYAQYVLDRLLSDVESEAPWRTGAVVLPLLAILSVLWFWHTPSADAALQTVADAVAAAASVLLLMPLTVALLHFDETTVANANRARERRGRGFELLGGGAVPRWGLSLTGIVLIFLALGWFGAAPVADGNGWRLGATAVLLCAVLGVFGGGWREGFAIAVVAMTACVVVLWWQRYDPRLPFGDADALAIASLAGLAGLSAARHMRMWRHAGDAPEMVRRRALEDSAGTVFAAITATAALLPGLILAGAEVFVLGNLTAGLAGALLFPAVLTGIETVVPRRRSVEEVFGLKRKR